MSITTEEPQHRVTGLGRDTRNWRFQMQHDPTTGKRMTNLPRGDIRGQHLSHCYQGEYQSGCKYGEDETCPARPSTERTSQTERAPGVAAGEWRTSPHWREGKRFGVYLSEGRDELDTDRWIGVIYDEADAAHIVADHAAVEALRAKAALCDTLRLRLLHANGLDSFESWFVDAYNALQGSALTGMGTPEG